jgi:hypothetical protein
VKESSSQKTPSKSHTNQQKEARLNDKRSQQNQATTVKTSGRTPPQEAYKPPKSRKKQRQQSLSYKITRKSRHIGQNGQTVAYKRSPKEQAKSSKNERSENAEKKPTKVETNRQSCDSKSEMQLLLQPQIARNLCRPLKEQERIRKCSFYCSQMQPLSTELGCRPIQRRQSFGQMQPILQPNAAFIVPKLGEGRGKPDLKELANLNGGPTSRNKYR